MIGSVNSSGWSVQTDAARLANDLVTKVDGNAHDIAKAARQTVSDRLAGQDEVDNGTGYVRGGIPPEQQIGDELAAQLDQSRFSREEIAARNPTAQAAFGRLDTENRGYLDREALQAAFSEMSGDSAANAEKVEQIFKALDADGNNQISESEFSIGIDQIERQRADQTSIGNPIAAGPADGNAPPAAGVPVQAAQETFPADINRDGAVSLQELVSYQTQQAEVQQAEQGAQQERDVVNRIATQLVQTYGRFDPEIANATSQVNPFSATA